MESLYTIMHKVGSNTQGYSPTCDDLVNYARSAFGLSLDDHTKLMAKVSTEKVNQWNYVEHYSVVEIEIIGFSHLYSSWMWLSLRPKTSKPKMQMVAYVSRFAMLVVVKCILKDSATLIAW